MLEVHTDEEKYSIVNVQGKKFYIDELPLITAISFLGACIRNGYTCESEVIKNFMSQFKKQEISIVMGKKILLLESCGIDYKVIRDVFSQIDGNFFERLDAEFEKGKYANHSDALKNGFSPVMGRRSKDSPNHWEELDIDSYRINKPTVICLSGNEAITPAFANGFCKVAENMLGSNMTSNEYSLLDYVDIVGISYRDKWENGIGGFDKEDTEHIARNLLLPLFIDNDGNKLSIEDASKNMSLVSFFSWCHGNQEITHLIGKLENILVEEYNYTRAEVRRIVSNTRNVCHTPEIHKNMHVPTVYAISEQDKTRHHFDDDENEKSRDSIRIYHDNVGEIEGKSCFSCSQETIGINSLKLRNNIQKSTDEHSIWTIQREKDWSLKKFDNADGTQDYQGKNGDCVSQMMAYALARSVANSIDNYNSDKFIPKIPMEELMTELQDIKSAFSEEDLMPN